MEINIKIDCDNAVFVESMEVSSLLRHLSRKLQHTTTENIEPMTLQDCNGNTVLWLEVKR